MLNDARLYPRSRDDTSAPPSADALLALLRTHWVHEVLAIQPARSRRVHYVQWPQQRVMVRANPGWDGPTAPSLIVRYVDHLAQAGAPVPAIIPTQAGALSVSYQDQLISVETCLAGETADRTASPGFHVIGQALARVHRAAATFPPESQQLRSVGSYVQGLCTRAQARPLGAEAEQAVATCCAHLERAYAEVLQVEVPWLLCRGDVRNANTLITSEGTVWFTDFDSAEYAPALYDVVMPRIQWQLGPEYRLLERAEVGELLHGYQTVRPLQEMEWQGFPVIWAAYYVDRLTFLLHRRLQGTRQEDIQRLRAHVLTLPERAVALGEEVVSTVRSSG